MPKLRRLRVQSLEGVKAGGEVPLPPNEAKHVRVLRLQPGAELEVFDDCGLSARATLTEQFNAMIISLEQASKGAARLTLAVAWPKGKRAALLVEKCSELGVDRIIPVHYARSVVSKGDESEGLVRLRRIAGEAAKQSGRCDVPEIAAEQTLQTVLERDAPSSFALVLDPTAAESLPDILAAHADALRRRPLLLFIGPEGGFAPDELAAFAQAGLQSARIAMNVLRIETAALAACAIVGAVGGARSS